MLPRTARLRIGGLEDADEADRGGRESAEARQRRRYASMWDGARNILGDIMAQHEAQPAQQLLSPSQNNFNAESCLRLLEVIPENARNAKRLRKSAMRRLAQMMDDDQRTTVRRNRSRRDASPSSSSESESVYSSASDE